MFTVGTAGHVDHGKSTLVKALTGIDPDRLSEEKERGMTIDLGFAWLRLPSGREISIVDVPGHERFIKNMLAGVGGIDLALLVVAADEGVMPQTREHVAILDLLRVKRGLVALTKQDLVEPEWLEMVGEDLEEHLRGTALDGAPIIAVSAVSGEGLPELRAALDQLLAGTPERADKGQPRLPVDRVFTIAGFGTVVTGTLIDGHLDAGQEIEVLPRGLRSRVRGLQSHKQKIESAAAGTRVAVNLAGLATTDLARGDVVTTPRRLRPTRVLDAKLHLLPGAPKELEHNATVSFHVWSAETTAKVGLLDKSALKPGEDSWVQLRLADEVVVVKGDLFVVRTPSLTIGGGEVVEPHPKRHRRFQASVVARLDLLERGSDEELVLQALEARHPLEPAAIVQQSGLSAGGVQKAVAELVDRGELVRLGEFLTSRPAWSRLVEQVTGMLAAYHRQYPLRLGMPKEELKSRIAFPSRLFNDVVSRMVAEGHLGEEETFVHAASHAVRFTPEQERRVGRLMETLQTDPYAPPSRGDLEQEFGLEPEVLNALVDQGRLVKVGDGIVFAENAYQDMVRRVVDHIRANGKITVAEVRDILATSRKYALALMEHLDERRVTRRVGDERVLR